MSKSQLMHLRIEPDLKSQVEALLKEMGLTASDAVNMYFAQIVNRGEIPFAIKAKIPNAETLAALQEADDIKSGKISAPISMSVDDFFASMGD